MKIYTKTGDQGETGLLGGGRVKKDHIAIQACGDVDETNSCIGLALSLEIGDDSRKMLTVVQEELFVVGAQVAGCMRPAKAAGKDSQDAATQSNEEDNPLEIHSESVSRLEQQIDQIDQALPLLDAFILPGGSIAASQLHVARSVCRRAERSVVALQTELRVELQQVVVYLNRLSDLLFVMARRENCDRGLGETKWLP